MFTPMCLGIMEDVRRRVCDESAPGYRLAVARFFAPESGLEDATSQDPEKLPEAT
jgi:hypothetical protein